MGTTHVLSSPSISPRSSIPVAQVQCAQFEVTAVAIDRSFGLIRSTSMRHCHPWRHGRAVRLANFFPRISSVPFQIGAPNNQPPRCMAEEKGERVVDVAGVDGLSLSFPHLHGPAVSAVSGFRSLQGRGRNPSRITGTRPRWYLRAAEQRFILRTLVRNSPRPAPRDKLIGRIKTRPLAQLQAHSVGIRARFSRRVSVDPGARIELYRETAVIKWQARRCC